MRSTAVYARLPDRQPYGADHAGSIRLLRQQYPDVQIIGNKQTFGMLDGYHGITTDFMK